MRTVTNTNLSLLRQLTKAFTNHFLQGNVPLRHLLNAKNPFMSCRRSAFNGVNDLGPKSDPTTKNTTSYH